MLAARRLHLFEFNDQPWLPETLRRAETGYLGVLIRKARVFAPLAPRLSALVDLCSGDDGRDRIVDLCSGGGGPYPDLLALVDGARGRATTLTLTDLHPNAALGVVAADARAVPPSLPGVRTLFDGLHHFAPADARAIFADAAAARAPILVGEASERSVPALIACLLIPLFVLLAMPFVTPRASLALLLTYVVPILPLIIFWDGLVSCLRTYRVDELRALVAGLDDGYAWEAGELRRAGRAVTFLVGRPTQ